MDKLYEELFRSMNQFRKLKFSEMFPEVCKTDYFVLCTIMDKGENGQITIEERGYVERNVNKNDRRNTYVELTEAGRQLTEEARQTMSDFGKSVMSQVDEADMKRLISYLDNIYHIAEKEIEARKGQGRRKEREHE